MAVIQGIWTPRYDFRVARKVSCPEAFCRAGKGWPCTTKFGNVSSTVHAARGRKYQEVINAQEAQGT